MKEITLIIIGVVMLCISAMMWSDIADKVVNNKVAKECKK
jgi:hypothetical protein